MYWLTRLNMVIRWTKLLDVLAEAINDNGVGFECYLDKRKIRFVYCTIGG